MYNPFKNVTSFLYLCCLYLFLQLRKLRKKTKERENNYRIIANSQHFSLETKNWQYKKNIQDFSANISPFKLTRLHRHFLLWIEMFPQLSLVKNIKRRQIIQRILWALQWHCQRINVQTSSERSYFLSKFTMNMLSVTYSDCSSPKPQIRVV